MLIKKAIKEELVRERQPIGRRQLSHENDINSPLGEERRGTGIDARVLHH